MPRDQFVLGDVDEQILLVEHLDDGGQHRGDDFEGRGGDADGGDEDARVEVVLRDVVGEGAELFDADGVVAVEFDPDGADGGLGAGGFAGGRGGVGVFVEHGLGGAGGEVHFAPAACREEGVR